MRTGREDRQGIEGDRAIVAGALDRVADRIVALHQALGGLQVVGTLLAILERALPERPFALVPAAVGEHHRQGDLALAKNDADRLADLRLLDRMVEGMSYELVSDAEIPTVRFERRLFLARPAGNDRPNLGSGGKQRRGLGDDDLEIGVLGGGRVLLDGELKDLALGDDG